MFRHFRGIDKEARFRAAAKLIGCKDELLDVGGGTGDFFDFCHLSGTVADLSPHESLFGYVVSKHPYVTFANCNLPFKDRAFDAVLCLDTLEHIPKSSRPSMLLELQRVSRDRIILTFPERHYFLPVLLAIAELYHRVRASSVMRTSLRQHLQFGLPSGDEILAAVDGNVWTIEQKSLIGRRATFAWILQLLLPIIAFAPINSIMSSLLSVFPEHGESGDRLIFLRSTEHYAQKKS